MFAPYINDKHFIIQLMHNIQFVDTTKIIKYLTFWSLMSTIVVVPHR